MQYTYQFEIWRGERQWVVEAFDFPGVTQGEDVADACESAADLLRETALDALMSGEALPAPTFDNGPQHGGMLAVVSVDASLEAVEKMSASAAAKELGVSPARVTAMIASKLLDGWKDGRNTYVTVASVEARKASRPKAGRPRKAAANA